MKKHSSTGLVISGFMLVLSLLAGVIFVSLYTINENSELLYEIVHEQEEMQDIYRMTEAANNRALMLFRMAAIEDPFNRDEVYMRFKEQAGQFIKARDSMLSRSKGKHEEFFNWNDIQPLVVKGSRVQNEATTLIMENRINEAHETMLNEVIPIQDIVIAGLKNLLVGQRTVIDKDLGTAAHNAQTAHLLILSIGIPALILGFSITAFVTRRSARTETTILEQMKLAESASTAKSNFLANMSHEIRTPLTAIVGFAELLADDAHAGKDRHRAVDTIIRNGKHLHQVINDVLDLSKIEAGQLEIEFIPTNLRGLASEIESIIGMNAREKGLRFELNYQKSLPTHITTDPVRLKQILINLCSNALKFTHHGGITLTIEYRADDNNQGTVRFTVADTGIGMTEEEMGLIFQPFSQADSSTTRKFGGSGLGLSISRQLATQLGGTLSCTSSKGKGSIFTASITCRNITTEFERADDGTQPSNIQYTSNFSDQVRHLAGKILLAEDSPDNQHLIRLYVKATGAKLTIVDNGQQAVEEGLSGNYDLILMDMQMPILDGVEAIGKLRAENYQGIIVILTANAMKSDREKCLRAGANDYLTKPIDLGRFYTVLGEHLPHAHPTTSKDTTNPVLWENSISPATNFATSTSSLYDDPEFRDLIHQFLEHLPAMIDELSSAVDTDNWAVAQSVCHKLKGMGGAFGFPEVSAQAAPINTALKLQNITHVPALTKTLITTCQDILGKHQQQSA